MSITDQTEDPPTTVPEVLEHAAELIEVRGWAQGDDTVRASEVDNDLPICAGLAIQFAAGPALLWPGTPAPGVLALASRAANYFLTRTGHEFGIVGWNDAEGRTKDEVVTALREAAAAARAEQ